LSGHKNSSKSLWNTFGKILNRKKIKHLKIGSLNNNGTIQTEPYAISVTFDNFFSEIGEQLAKTFPNENNSEYKDYLGNSVNHSMYLFNTTLAGVLDVRVWNLVCGVCWYWVSLLCLASLRMIWP